MNFFAFLVALIVICVTFTEGAKCRCSIKDYKPIPCVNLIGKWYTHQRYDNGPQKNSKCTTCLAYLNATDTGSIIVWATEYGKDGVNRGLRGYVKPTSDLAAFRFKWPDSTEIQIIIVSSDNENYMIARTCYKFEEYVWIWTKKTNPSKKVQILIEAAIIEQKLDKSKLRTLCVGYEDADPEEPSSEPGSHYFDA